METEVELIKLIVLRECALYKDQLEELRTPEINESLLTIRIYREDIEFWERYEAELVHLVHKFLKHTQEMPPIGYSDLNDYVKLKLKN